MSGRQIVHVDMDAFYASVEQRDDASLRGKPVVVAWLGKRSVVCAASYEARKYGIRSAMPALTAERLCPSAIFVPPDFTRYRAASHAVREIFQQHTDLIEPLSLDEAYLDVTQAKSGLTTGFEVATAIRAQILEEVHLTASAGVAPNKFLAKIASDWKKPNGLFEIRPEEVLDFLKPLPVGKLPGVGKVTEDRLTQLCLKTVGEIRALELAVLESNFGSHGRRLYELARGIDNGEVVPDRPTKSISAEDTFEFDLSLADTTDTLVRLAERVWNATVEEGKIARSVSLKLKNSEFKVITRGHTPETAPASSADLVEIVLWLQARVGLDPHTKFRLVGVGVSNFVEPGAVPTQMSLFTS
jgi:DNA polymerase-4